MKLFYRPAALEDIRRSADYIQFSLKNPMAARKFRTKIMQGTSLLKENPFLGRTLQSKYEGLDTTMRFIVVSRQLVFYKVLDHHVEIIRILDGRTDYMTKLFDTEE